MENLRSTKAELKILLTESIPEVIAALKKILPESAPKYGDILLLEGRLNDENRKLLQGIRTNEELQLAYNQIRAALLDFIDALTEEDFSKTQKKTGAPSGAKQGELLYRIPRKMMLKKETKCIIRIAIDEEEIVKNLELDANVALRSLSRISNLMQVILMDPGSDQPFDIRTISEPEQIIFEDTYTEWVFYVTPLKEGVFPLVIKVAVIELILNKERKREIIFEEEINVITSQPESTEQIAFQKANQSFAVGGMPGNTTAQVAPLPQRSPKGWIKPVAGLLAFVALSIFGLQQSNFSSNGDAFAFHKTGTPPSGMPQLDNNALAYAEVRTPNVFETDKEELVTQPAKWKTTSKQAKFEEENTRIMTKEASSKFEGRSAAYKTNMEQVLASAASTRYTIQPPQFKTVSEQILVKEELKVPDSRNVKYETKQVKVLESEAYTKLKIIPAIYETVTEKVFVQDGYMRQKLIPAEYKTEEVVVKDGYTLTEYTDPIYEDQKQIVEIRPASVKWLLKKKTACQLDQLIDCMEWVEEPIPAQYDTIEGAKKIKACPEGYELSGTICGRTKTIPPETISVQKLVKDAMVVDEKVEPVYRTISKTVLKTPASVQEVKVPATYKSIAVQTIKNKNEIPDDEIQRTYKTITYRKVTKHETKIEQYSPPQYRTTSWQVVTKPASYSITGSDSSAEFKTIKKSKLVEPPSEKIDIIVPAQTRAVEKKTLVKKGGEKIWVPVLKSPSSMVVSQLQDALQSRGYYKGEIDGKGSPELLTALTLFQNDQQLPIGGLDLETLKMLGIQNW